MASPIGYSLVLEDPEYVDTWIRCFAANARCKKLKDNKNTGGENEITDLFMATAGCEAIMKVATMVYPRELEEMTFEEISQVIKGNMRPKKRLVIAERTKFMAMKQEVDEPIVKYLHRLRSASKYCEFEKLGTGEQTTEEELIQLRLIEGMHNSAHRYKLMEQLQLTNMPLNMCIEFIQQQELIHTYNQNKNKSYEEIMAETYTVQTKRKNCAYCGKIHEMKKEKCPAFGKTCSKITDHWNLFSTQEKSYRKLQRPEYYVGRLD